MLVNLSILFKVTELVGGRGGNSACDAGLPGQRSLLRDHIMFALFHSFETQSVVMDVAPLHLKRISAAYIRNH